MAREPRRIKTWPSWSPEQTLRRYIGEHMSALYQQNGEILAELSDTQARLSRIEAALGVVIRAEKETAMSRVETKASLDALRTQLMRNTDLAASTKALLEGLYKAIDDAGSDVDEINAAVEAFRANNDTLVAAAIHGTPAAPPSEPPVPPIVDAPSV